MVNAQDYINKKYGFSSKKKEAEEVLDIKEKSLEGHLDLSGFVNLKELDCSYNELDSLDVSECSNLTRLDLSYNSFDDIDFLLKLPNPEKLIYINIEESGVSLSEEEVKEKLSQFINLGGSSNALEEIKSISLEKQKFEDKVEALKKENHFLKSQLDEIQKKKSEFEKEILNWEEVEKTECHLREIGIKRSEYYWEKDELERKIEKLDARIKELEQLSSTNKELEEELVKVKKEKIDLEEKLKEKEKEIIELQNESEGNMEKLKELICKLKNQIDRIRKEKNKLEKKLLEEIDRTIKIRREELKNFVEKKILSRNIIGKEKKKRSKIEKLYKKQWQVAKSSGNQELTSSLNEELDKLSKKVKDLIGSENYEKIYNWQEEIIKLEIEQKDLKELTFNESFSYIYDSVITAKEKRLGGLVDQVENKLGKDEEGKKILRNWVSKDDLNEKIFETLKGRGVDEKYRKELDSTKEELIKLKSEKELEMKTKDFLNAQKSFLASRQQTIKELQECCNKLEIFINEKYAVFLEISDAISNIGSAVDSKLTLGVPKIIGETAKTISNFSKIKIAKKSNKEFQLLLGNEEKELSKLRDNFNTLVKFVQFNQELVSNSLFAGILRGKSSTKLFDNKYEVYDVIIKDEVWKGRPLNSERMGKVIVSLSQNFEELEKEVEIQEKQFEEFRDKKHQQLETYQEQFPK